MNVSIIREFNKLPREQKIHSILIAIIIGLCWLYINDTSKDAITISNLNTKLDVKESEFKAHLKQDSKKDSLQFEFVKEQLMISIRHRFELDSLKDSEK